MLIASVNSAYDFSRKHLKKLAEIRDDLEKELNKTIGLNIMLKGKITRVS